MKPMINYIFLVFNILLFIVLICFAVFNGISQFRMGKDFVLEATSNQVVDWNYINNDTSPENNLKLLNDDTKNKLVTFMKNNNLVVKEGLYNLNQSDYIQEVLMKLRFKAGPEKNVQ